jgi:hypothetical protein
MNDTYRLYLSDNELYDDAESPRSEYFENFELFPNEDDFIIEDLWKDE